MTDELRGSTAHPLCHWHDEDIRKMKEETEDLDRQVMRLADRIPEKFSADWAVMVSDVGNIKHALESRFITRDEFEPIKKLTYGAVSVILSAVIIALVALVLKGDR